MDGIVIHITGFGICDLYIYITTLIVLGVRGSLSASSTFLWTLIFFIVVSCGFFYGAVIISSLTSVQHRRQT